MAFRVGGSDFPYISYIGICRTEGYAYFLAVFVRNRVPILSILASNRIWCLHSCLKLGVFFRWSYLFVIKQVWNRVLNFWSSHKWRWGKSQILALHKVRDMRSGPHTPTQVSILTVMHTRSVLSVNLSLFQGFLIFPPFRSERGGGGKNRDPRNEVDWEYWADVRNS